MDRDFNFPKSTAFANTAGVNVLFRFGMQTARPFELVKDTEMHFTEPEDWENKPWLTSLVIDTDSDKFHFPEAVLTITQERNIVTTPLQGRNGTIKEYISDGDYNITLDASVMSFSNSDPNNEDSEVGFKIAKNIYPINELERLRKILSTKTSIRLHSDFLIIFGIKSAVVKSFSLQQETHSNRQSIQIQMLSDEPYEIKEIKEDYVKVK